MREFHAGFAQLSSEVLCLQAFYLMVARVICVNTCSHKYKYAQGNSGVGLGLVEKPLPVVELLAALRL